MQITDHAGGGAVYLPARDANGNITALIDAGATAAGANPVAASYEYSPFGELLRVEGPYAAANPFRFSSKFTDDETGLVCYGLRDYNPALDRFLNRDPIGEAGGPNLYAFCGNNGVNRWDFLGLADPTVGMPEGGGSSGTWDNIINLGGFDSGWGSYGSSRGTSLVDGSKHDSQNKDFPSIRRWLESRVTGGKTYADWDRDPSGGDYVPLIGLAGRLPGVGVGTGALSLTLGAGAAVLGGGAIVIDGVTSAMTRPVRYRDWDSGPQSTLSGAPDRARPLEGFFIPENADPNLVGEYLRSRGSDPGRARQIMSDILADAIGSGTAVARSEVVYLNPSQIRFSQPTASQNFSTGQTITGTADALRNGQPVSSIPTIRVVEYQGQLYTLDNRRLAALGAAGLSRIPVQVLSLSDPAVAQEFLEKFNPVNGGQNIVITPTAGGRRPAETLLRSNGKIR